MNASIRSGLILALALFVRAFGGDSPNDESSGYVTTLGGTAIQCLISHASPWTIATANGVQTLKPAEIASIWLGERIDPNAENDALVSVGELQNENFETREKAEAKLRSMGRVAAKPLRQALASPDKEVARRARALLVEMGAVEDAGWSQDRVTLRDGSTIKGELALTDFIVRSRFGRLRFPIEALERLVFHAAAPVAPAGAGPFAATDAREIAVPLPLAGPVEAAAAARWDPYEEARADPTSLDGWLAEAQRNALTMDKIADPKTEPGARRVLIPTRAGDRLEEAYADRGALLKAEEPGVSVVVSAEKLASFSKAFSAAVKKSDLEVRFVLPKSGAANAESESAGVFHVGAIVRTDGPGTVGMAAYDAAGRLLTQVANLSLQPGVGSVAPAGPRDEFMGVSSKTPIARLRIFRTGTLKEKGGDILVDDLLFDHVAIAGLRGDECRVTLAGGDRLAGKAVETDGGDVALKLDFLGEKSEPVKFKLAAISRYEPARSNGAKEPEKKDEAEKEPVKQPRRFGAPHGVLLQSGETFRARLLSLDDTTVVFGLASGTMLKLPRGVLRKVELIPAPHPPGDPIPPTAVTADEKPGVNFRSKPTAGNSAAPLPPTEEVKDPAKNPAKGVPGIDDAEIVSVDPKAREITVKDKDGEMTMSLAGIKSLIFPANPNAAVAAVKRGWTLALREGSRFDAEVTKITPTEITAEIAGGIVSLLAETVEWVERK